jgi:hypothetical protein
MLRRVKSFVFAYSQRRKIPRVLGILTNRKNFCCVMVESKVATDVSCPKHFELTNQLTAWKWALLEEQPVLQLVKNFSAFYGTLSSITVFITVARLFISWTKPIQSTPAYSIFSKIQILSIHLCLRLPSGLFHSGFPTIVLHTLFIKFEECKLWSSSLCSSLQPPITSSIFGPNNSSRYS